MSQPGRLMGIDHGEARIGIALSDPLQIIAQPALIIKHTSQQQDFALIERAAVENGVIRLVIGLPSDGLGRPGNQAQLVIQWARKLARVVGLPITFWDESYSSIDAREIRRANRKRRTSDRLDSIAAAVILQDYLAALTGGNHEPGQPLEAFSDLD